MTGWGYWRIKPIIVTVIATCFTDLSGSAQSALARVSFSPRFGSRYVAAALAARELLLLIVFLSCPWLWGMAVQFLRWAGRQPGGMTKDLETLKNPPKRDDYPRVAGEYAEGCPKKKWENPGSFDLLRQFVVDGATLEDLFSEGAPVTPQFVDEWRRVKKLKGTEAKTDFTPKVVLALDDLARSLNVADDLPLQIRAHRVRASESAQD
jgi:hypothetical protein